MHRIFIVRVSAPLDGRTTDFLLNFINGEKHERIFRQRVKQNADNMLISEILAKTAIKKVFGTPIKSQNFIIGKYGKPYLEGYDDIHFSVSHSGEYVACVVSDREVGIDIQKISEYNIAVAGRVFTKEQVLQIEQSHDKASEFTRLWTQKEAYLKMLGTGFGGKAPLDDVSCEIESGRINEYYISVCYL